jgi:hypothetical protein
MRAMTSRQIHNAISTALSEVARALASGEMDRSGRFYSDSELRERFANIRSVPSPRKGQRVRFRSRKTASRQINQR